MNLQPQLHKVRNICKDITSLVSINSAFLDNKGESSAEFYHMMAPNILQDYFDSQTKKFYPISKVESDYESYTVSNIYGLFFIVTPVIIEHQNLGYIYVGPFLFETPDQAQLQNLFFHLNLPKTLHHVFKQYVASMEILTNGRITTIMKCILRMLPSVTQGSDEYLIHISHDISQESLVQEDSALDFDSYHHLHLIERRYESENQLYHAVEKGDYQTASSVVFDNQIMFKFLERVPNNPLRSHKNLFFVQNTLLRKAAEKGGVHPIYTDSVSGKYAILIERVQSVTDFSQLYANMLFEYCELVQTHSLKNYSPFVGKIIEYIRLNIDKPLQLATVAELLNASVTTVSRRFKEEVHEAFPDYINRIRMEEAQKLMEHKEYSLTQIALKVGYNDVNYFTKVFKKLYGCTPSEYQKKLD